MSKARVGSYLGFRALSSEKRPCASNVIEKKLFPDKKKKIFIFWNFFIILLILLFTKYYYYYDSQSVLFIGTRAFHPSPSVAVIFLTEPRSFNSFSENYENISESCQVLANFRRQCGGVGHTPRIRGKQAPRGWSSRSPRYPLRVRGHPPLTWWPRTTTKNQHVQSEPKIR